MSASEVSVSPVETDSTVATPATENVMGSAVEVEAPAVEVAVEYTDFTMPEGLEVPEENIAQFKEMAKTAGLSQEQAQKVLDAQASALVAQREAAELHKTQEKKSWVDELKKDPDFGGAKLPETIERANRTLREFGSPELVALLKETGYANNPHVVRMFAKFDRAQSEDKLAEGKGTPMVEKTAADLIYDNPTSR